MTDKCKFCGAEMETSKNSVNFYTCGTIYGFNEQEWWRDGSCYNLQIAALEAELKQLRDEDDTPPIDERLAAAGKIFRELVAEREELRREVERLRDEISAVEWCIGRDAILKAIEAQDIREALNPPKQEAK